MLPRRDAQRLLWIEEDEPLKDQKIAFLKQQNAIHEKLTELAKREADGSPIAFEREKELTDRALNLAEIGKPKSNWELQGVLGLAAFVLGFLAAR